MPFTGSSVVNRPILGPTFDAQVVPFIIAPRTIKLCANLAPLWAFLAKVAVQPRDRILSAKNVGVVTVEMCQRQFLILLIIQTGPHTTLAGIVYVVNVSGVVGAQVMASDSARHFAFSVA